MRQEIARLRSSFTTQQLVKFHAQLPADPSSDTPKLASYRTMLMLMSEEEDGPVALALAAGAEAGSRKQMNRAARQLRSTVRTSAAPAVHKAKAAQHAADARAQEWAKMLQRSSERLKRLGAEVDVVRSDLCDDSSFEALYGTVFQLIAMRNQVREASLEMSGAPSERAQMLLSGCAGLITSVERALEKFQIPADMLQQVEADVDQKGALADSMLRSALQQADLGFTSRRTEAAAQMKDCALSLLIHALSQPRVELLAEPALLRTAHARRHELEQERDTASILAQREVVARRTLKLHAAAVAAQEEAAAREAEAVGLMQDAMRRGVHGTPAVDAAVAAANRAHALAHAKAEPLLEKAIAAAEEAAALDTRAADVLLRNATRTCAPDLEELSGLLEECGHAASPDVRKAAQVLRDELKKQANQPHEKRPGRRNRLSTIEASYAY